MNNWQHFATFKIGGRKITAPQFQLPANPIKIQASADSSPPMDQTEIMNWKFTKRSEVKDFIRRA